MPQEKTEKQMEDGQQQQQPKGTVWQQVRISFCLFFFFFFFFFCFCFCFVSARK